MEGRNVVLRPVNQDEERRREENKTRTDKLHNHLKKNQCLYFASRNMVPLVPRNWLISA